MTVNREKKNAEKKTENAQTCKTYNFERPFSNAAPSATISFQFQPRIRFPTFARPFNSITDHVGNISTFPSSLGPLCARERNREVAEILVINLE